MNSLELIHAKIHGLRMNDKYKASKFEGDVNYIIADEFKEQCRECKLKFKTLNLESELKQLRPEKPKESFLGGLFKG